MSPSKKGFVFTVDAFVALTLVILVIFVIVYQLNIPSAFFPQQTQTYNYARDVVSTLGTLTIRDLKDNSDFSSLMFTLGYSDPVTTEDEHTILEQIAAETLQNPANAQTIAQALLASGSQPMIPAQFGAKITVDGQDIIIRGTDVVPFTRIQSTASYVLMGYTSSRNPGAPRYDYPAYEPENKKYCSDCPDCLPDDNQDDFVNGPAFPCDVYFQTSSYEPGVITETPIIVRVSVWT
jgi:hypothetical protein